MKVVALTNKEEFIGFIDPDMLSVTEDASIGGLRTIKVEFNIQELTDAKQLFQLGNKLWIAGDGEITDCLYVINTKVKQSLFKDNKFVFDAEEVLVELNYAPLFRQTDLTKANGFTVNKGNDQSGTYERSVTINWNALNYWFGDYFNIGVVQACLNSYVAKVPLNGTMTLMSLLRKIEEETGNYFITRYEKDINTNVIHRYLDFLNPHSQNKNWELNLEYDFLIQDETSTAYDENGNPVTEDADVTDDPPVFTPDPSRPNINPNNIIFRITKDNEPVTGLSWTPNIIGFGTGLANSVISLRYKDNKLGLKAYAKVYSPRGLGYSSKGYVNEWIDEDYENPTIHNGINVTLLDGSCFEIYDTVHQKVLYQVGINSVLSDVHEEVLDLGFNVENVEFEVDETDTYTAVSPVFTLNENNDARNGLTYGNMNTLINRWLNLSVSKGDIIPMILEKVNITGTDEHPCVKRTGTVPDENSRTAEQLLKTYNLHSNYWSRPLKPTDDTDNTNKSYEYWRATAYWKAPFTKHAGEMHISLPNKNSIEYDDICCRPDLRDERDEHPLYEKMGTTNTSEEDPYAIYNAVVMYLKNHKDPDIDITVDVANLRDNRYNAYNLHDKVYVKLPGQEELITAKVESTSKNAHDMAKNTVTLGNYNITTKVAPKETYIDASNANFKYPSKKKLTATLRDATYDESSTDASAFLKNKLVTFTVYQIEKGSTTLTGKVYTKKTNSQGKATITMNFKPGDYEIDISFGGDAEYEETSITVEVNVSGTIEQPKTNTTGTKNKTTTKNTSTKKTYWSKCGVSPDKKKVIAVAKPSARDGNYSYKLWKTTFKNYCPECGRTGTLRFDGGFANKCITSAGAHGRGYKTGVPEHEITCIHCDSDYDGVTGLEKNSRHSTRLTRLTKPVKSSKTEFNTLVKGKLQYGTTKKTVATKTKLKAGDYNNHQPGIAKDVKKKAISLAGGTSGLTALKRIAAFMGSDIKYAYSTGFTRTPKTTLKKKAGNCCSQTRLMLQMFDVVDVDNKFKLEYVHVCCGPKGVGHVFAKVTTRSTGKWRYVDPCKRTPWGKYVHGWGNPPGSRTVYPSLPV